MTTATNFLTLAKTQKRLAHDYRRWALEDEATGNLPRYRRHRAESNRLWRDSKKHLAKARIYRSAI